jgi:S1-C subfamily serine protease
LFAIGQDKTLPFQSTANKEIIVHVKVKSIKPLSDAEKAGLMAGDEIIFVNGKKPNDIIELFFNDENKPIKLTVLRGNYKFETILMSL